MPAAPILCDSLLDLVGGTPLLQLHHALGADASCGRILGKCEQWNPGGSVKDRIALSMIEAAEAAGRIRPGESVIVEPTSGNTGIGLALVCAVKGYRLILTMPASMSLERRELLRAYGARIELTDPERAMEGAVVRAQQIAQGEPHSFLPQQFENPANPEAHRRGTALEILEQLGEQRIDAFVSAVGTGGTLTGVGGALRERFPDILLVAVEPAASPVLAGGAAGPHKIQGIGAGFVPMVLDRALVDEVIAVSDEHAWDAKVQLARREGLLVGPSAGAAVVAAVQVARRLGPDSTVVTVLCDTGERYFSLDEHFAGRTA